MNYRTIIQAALASVLAGTVALASAQPHWATSWMAAPEPTWGRDFALPVGMPLQLENATLRQPLRLSVGGQRIRLVIDNQHSDQPLRLGRARVALEGGGAAAQARFQGREDAIVAAGAKALSDPIALPVPAGARLEVDLYFPHRTQLAGFHWDARERSLLASGDMTGQPAPAGAQALSTRAFLSAVMVESAREPVAVVALGDSITDGNGATPGADRRWPDFLARRLAPHGIATLNAGISGNRLLRPGMGDSALARLERDALLQPGVRTVIVMLGTNDIGWPGAAFAPHEKLPAVEEIAGGFRQLVEQAHLRGVRVIGATVTPFENALEGTPLEGHYSPAKDATRQALNDWIRQAGVFDGVVDFDRVLRDPSRPSRLRAEFDSGDHLHPNDAGYQAMADAIDLGMLSIIVRP
jgi:lysophospholipase L1-like esterase